MVRVNLNNPGTPEWEELIATCDEETQALLDNWNPRAKPRIKKHVYKRFKSFYTSKDSPFHGKCAYCETQHRYHDDLDHYRPKMKVTDEKDEVVKVVDDEGNELNHPGYYWLAYSWDNLLPVCKECNSPSRQKNKSIGKRNRFPVEGDHAFQPGYEQNEDPLLLNPTLEEPSDHLEWDNDKKVIIAKPTSRKGKMTLEILGFNYREQLHEDWSNAYDQVFQDLMSLFSPHVQDKETKIRQYKQKVLNGEVAYSFVAQTAISHFTELLNA